MVEFLRIERRTSINLLRVVVPRYRPLMTRFYKRLIAKIENFRDDVILLRHGADFKYTDRAAAWTISSWPRKKLRPRQAPC